jgi:hypothetical protein
MTILAALLDVKPKHATRILAANPDRTPSRHCDAHLHRLLRSKTWGQPSFTIRATVGPHRPNEWSPLHLGWAGSAPLGATTA